MTDELTFQTVFSASDHRGPGISVTKIAHRATGFVALAYQCSLEEDLDGAPDAYGLDNAHPVNAAANPATALQHNIEMLETGLANAADPWQNCLRHLNHQNLPADHDPFRWVGIFAERPTVAHRSGLSVDERGFLEARGFRDAQGNLHTLAPGAEGAFPVIQPDLGRDGQSNAVVGAPGFYVSTTSTVTDLSLDAWDQSWYLDATEIPYAAWAGWMAHFGLQQGDFGLALRYNSEASSGYVYGDAGAGNVGEVSRALFETLAPGRDNEPRDFIFLAFPGSGTLKVSPAALINIQTRVNDRVRRLNAVPNNEALATFLSFGANLDKFKRFQARKLSDAEMVAADSRYPRAEFALRSCGFIPGGG
jgi:hypothetical protein